jgi:hypothetical protein
MLKEILDSGKTPEEVCGDSPELLEEVRRRWQEFQLIDAQVQMLLPGLSTRPAADAIEPPVAGLPQVPGYEVEGELGRGGMGVVYKARHLALKRTVALKMLVAGHPNPAERARFRAEAEAVARLQHPNIVQIHELGEAEGRPFFALEYVAGGSLAERLAGQPLPPRDAARLVATLAEAMHLAHSRNLVHRDLKPGNILLQIADSRSQSEQDNSAICNLQSAIPKITDFGLVRQLDADSGQTFHGVVMGTPSYMAPEQAEGLARAAGPSTDVYALGAILYECLTGRPPFEGATPLETLAQVRSREPTAPSSLNRQVPRDLETICLKCLRKEPERRYASARELAEDLGRFERGEPVAARPVGRLERVVKWVRRNPTVAFLSAVAALAVVAGTVASLLFGVEASRKAEALEKKTIQAQENARRAEDNEREMGRVLVSGLLISIGRNTNLLNSALSASETDAMRQLRAAPVPLRMQFLETALQKPETARRVGRRADWIVQAIVGCDRAVRAEMENLVVRRIQDPDVPEEVKFACALIGLALNVSDRAWAERSADVLLVALKSLDPMSEGGDYPALADALAGVWQRLPPNQAADHAGRALGFFMNLLKGKTAAPIDVGRAIVVISPYVDPAAANLAATDLGSMIHDSASLPGPWYGTDEALAAVCRRLPSSDAASHINRTVDFILEVCKSTTDREKVDYTLRAHALDALCGQLDAARASRVAGALIAMLGDSQMVGMYKLEYISNTAIVSALTKVAQRLDAHGSLRAAEGLILVLRKTESITAPRKDLTGSLVALCKQLDAAGAARVAEAMVAGARDPKTTAHVRVLFADARAALTDRLTPDQTASLDNALAEPLLADLADAKLLLFRELVGKALATTSASRGAAAASRAAEALTAAICDRKTQRSSLKLLAVALAEVSGRLPPKEASSLTNRSVDALDALWVARTAPPDGAFLAEALAMLWTRLDPSDAAARATRTAADLEEALRDSKTDPKDLCRLAFALSAVSDHLPPAERSARAALVPDTLVAVLQKQRDQYQIMVLLSEAPATLFANLDRPCVLRTADALLAVLGDPNTQPKVLFPGENVNRFAPCEPMFQRIASRLDERDLLHLLDHHLVAGDLQRLLLGVLAGSKKRTFRNTWDYLDDKVTR